jgi:ribosomal-protein-alanine N-acetyltransferase
MLRGERTLLRPWRDADRAPYAALNADPEVRRWFPGTLTPAESNAQIDRFIAHQAAHDFCFWALELPGVTPCAGFVGLQHSDTIPGPHTIEIGWRLARDAWGCGYATEAARLSVAFAFDRLGLDVLHAYTAEGNAPSRRVMQRLGMQQTGDFLHPSLAPDHPLARHVLYRLRREQAQAA